MEQTSLFKFINKFYPLNFMIIITTFLLIKPGVLSSDLQFEACEPNKCGENLIKYPFWIPAQQESYCGHRELEIICKDDKSPMIFISDDYYVILDIFYQNQSFLVANANSFNDSICLTSLHNFTSPDAFISLIPDYFRLYFFYNCTSVPEIFTYSIPCATYGGHTSYAALLRKGGSQYLNASLENCDSVIAAPIDVVVGETPETMMKMNYKEILRKGFLLEWNSSDCSDCERSGGRCGFYRGEFVCFCKDQLYPRKCKKVARGRLEVAIATAIIGALIVLMVVIILYFRRRKRSRKNSPKLEEFLKNFESLAPKRYKYSDIRKLTNSFQDKLGQGGYGSVFKGQLQDGRMVAVKLLNETKGNNNNSDGEEFVNEVASISRTSHVNIVTLLGFCVEGPKRALIYEFMCNGSLEKFIYMKNSSEKDGRLHQLGWDTLYKIAIGIARGLEYLHRGCHMQIVHFDIKPHNILLDEDFSPKISDFGLAKLCLGKESVMSTMCARGTIGYIAPELVSRTFGRVSHKSDVYSYGMMVLEMVGGRKNVDVEADNTSEIYFPHWIYNRLDHQSGEMRLMGRIMTEEDKEIARKLITVALWCIQINPSIRPPMNKVLEMLEGALEDLQIPPKPGFSSLLSPQETNCAIRACSDISIF